MAFRRAMGYLKKLSMLPVYRYQQIGLESFEYFIHTWYGMSLINHQFAGKGKKKYYNSLLAQIQKRLLYFCLNSRKLLNRSRVDTGRKIEFTALLTRVKS